MNHQRTTTYTKVDKTAFLAGSNTPGVLTMDKKPRGDKFYLYAEHGKHSCYKSELRRLEIQQELLEREKQLKSRKPHLTQDHQVEYEAEKFFINFCQANHIKITKGAEFNTRIGGVIHRGRLVASNGEVIFKSDRRNQHN
jgi:hypothetical protein